jgi:cytoskeleton protein RodZ
MSEGDTPTQERTAGEQLRVAREAAGLTVADVASKLKLSSRQVGAIEAEDWTALPERTFTRGFFRSYARLLGVDEKLIDSAFAKTEPTSEVRALHGGIGEVAHDNTPARMPIAKWSIPAALLLFLAAGIAWFLWQGAPMPQQSSKLPLSEVPKALAKTEQPSNGTPQENSPLTNLSANTIDVKNVANGPSIGALIANTHIDPRAANTASLAEPPKTAVVESVAATPPSTQSVPAPSLATPSDAVPSPSRVTVGPGQKRVKLVVTGRSWTEIRSRGEVVASETLSDSSREFALTPPLSFVVGSASNVRLSIDGKPYDFSMHVRNEVARFRVE